MMRNPGVAGPLRWPLPLRPGVGVGRGPGLDGLGPGPGGGEGGGQAGREEEGQAGRAEARPTPTPPGSGWTTAGSSPPRSRSRSRATPTTPTRDRDQARDQQGSAGHRLLRYRPRPPLRRLGGRLPQPLGTPFDGSHGSWPAALGKGTFDLQHQVPGPGWANKDATTSRTPRPEPFGPIPADLGQVSRACISDGDKDHRDLVHGRRRHRPRNALASKGTTPSDIRSQPGLHPDVQRRADDEADHDGRLPTSMGRADHAGKSTEIAKDRQRRGDQGEDGRTVSPTSSSRPPPPLGCRPSGRLTRPTRPGPESS